MKQTEHPWSVGLQERLRRKHLRGLKQTASLHQQRALDVEPIRPAPKAPSHMTASVAEHARYHAQLLYRMRNNLPLPPHPKHLT